MDETIPVTPLPPPPEAREADRLRRKISRTMLRTVCEQGLIEEGDRILVAVSGGKDSATLLDLLRDARAKAPVDFEILAFHLDQGQPGYDGGPLRAWLAGSGIPHEIAREDTFSIVKAKASERSTYCVTCSRLRRGILHTAARRFGCNKLALGHHRDDALETLLLNLFYAGRLQAIPARYTTREGNLVVIRPLIECAESDIARHAALARYPIIPCGLCGSQPGLKRNAMEALLRRLDAEIPEVRRSMIAALKNVRASHLLDPEVAKAWEDAAHRYAPRK
jgi:tRNA 2-thiocytidine biosynthesis protein TtcA